jgi:ATP adenylyltransferase
MYDKNCQYCTKSEEMNAFAVEIAELKESFVGLCRDSNYKGRCVVVLKEHKSELYELDDKQRNAYMKDVCRVARAIKRAFKADKVNISVYGDTVTHIHMHVVPKKKGGPEWGSPFLVDRAEIPGQTPVFMSETEMNRCRKKLLKELKIQAK